MDFLKIALKENNNRSELTVCWNALAKAVNFEFASKNYKLVTKLEKALLSKLKK